MLPSARFKLKNPLYTFDSTLIDECLSLYPWAMYRKKKGAFKLHTLLDHSGYLPSFMVITDGKIHDINVVKDASYSFPSLSPDSMLLIDRAYIASTIAGLYKSRWEIETFFKWIKQNLKIKSFLGTSRNAVMTQVRAAMITIFCSLLLSSGQNADTHSTN